MALTKMALTKILIYEKEMGVSYVIERRIRPLTREVGSGSGSLGAAGRGTVWPIAGVCPASLQSLWLQK